MRAVFFAWSLALASSSGAAIVAAQDRVAAEREEPRAAPAEPSAPREHFEQALVHYRAGRYRAAIVELRAAIALDPESKDLVYNLALVHEKLGELDLAIGALERYVALEPDANEITRAEQTIVRLRGARSELEAAPAPAAPPPARPSLAPPPGGPAPQAATSRVDGWLIASSSVSLAAALVGVVFGVRALALSPGSDPRTDENTSIEDLRDDRRRAERAALVADLGFAVSLAAGAASAALWFGRAPGCDDAHAKGSLAVSWSSAF